MTFNRAYVESWIADIVAEVRSRHGMDVSSKVSHERIVAFDIDLKYELEERGSAAQVKVEQLIHERDRCRVIIEIGRDVRGLR